MSHAEDYQPEIIKAEEQWRRELTAEEFRVLREAGTEAPYSGAYDSADVSGVFACRACGVELFTSAEKFDSQCGWPAFWAPLAEERVRYLRDWSMGVERVEVRCSRCDSHLGHVFSGEGFPTPTDQRFCINSISMKLLPGS